MTTVLNQLGPNQFLIELPVARYVDGYLTKFIVISGDQINGRPNQTDIEVCTSEEPTSSSVNEAESGSSSEEQQGEQTTAKEGDVQ